MPTFTHDPEHADYAWSVTQLGTELQDAKYKTASSDPVVNASGNQIAADGWLSTKELTHELLKRTVRETPVGPIPQVATYTVGSLMSVLSTSVGVDGTTPSIQLITDTSLNEALDKVEDTETANLQRTITVWHARGWLNDTSRDNLLAALTVGDDPEYVEYDDCRVFVLWGVTGLMQSMIDEAIGRAA